MKINIYYGGRGIMGDPSLFVLQKMGTVLEELNVKVERINLYDEKRNITALPSTLNDLDGCILAATVEWYGIGGYMTEFLDACWFYGNKSRISQLYMCPVVMSTTYGERDGLHTLLSAWDMLGGKPCDGLCGYVKDSVAFELDQEYIEVIERAAENFYRAISRRTAVFPASNLAIKQMVAAPDPIDLTPQETEQLSKYAADDNYVQTQKEDIRELASHFKNLLANDGATDEEVLLMAFKEHFVAARAIDSLYKFKIKEIDKPLIVDIEDGNIRVSYEEADGEDVLCKLNREKLEEITSGAATFQRAFMSGDMQVRGDFKLLRSLDTMFSFKNNM